MKILTRLDNWLDENELRRFVNEANFRWFLILLAGGAAVSIGWSMTRVLAVMFVAYYVLNPLTAKRLAQLIVILSLVVAGLLLIHNEYRAANLSLAIYLLFGVLVLRLLWDDWRSKRST
jgi:hypothetical protein